MVNHYGTITNSYQEKEVNPRQGFTFHLKQSTKWMSIFVVVVVIGSCWQSSYVYREQDTNIRNSVWLKNRIDTSSHVPDISSSNEAIVNGKPFHQLNELGNGNKKKNKKTATVYLKHYGDSPKIQFDVEDDQHGQAVAIFSDDLEESGWSQLWVKAYPIEQDENEEEEVEYSKILASLYSAGFAEGALTHHRLYEHFNNTYVTFFNEKRAPSRVEHFFVQNLRWIRDQVKRHTDQPEKSKLLNLDYWHVIGGIMAQFDGLVAGYNQHCKKGHELSETDLYLLNADGDLQDLIPAMNHSRTRHPGDLLQQQLHPKSYEELVKSLKCSALVRLAPNNSDLLWGHATWDQYSAMNRIFKHYDLPIAIPKHPIQRRKVTFSSSPGYLASVDDYYITDAGLSIMETTNGVYRDSLYDLVVPQNTLTWMRTIVANLMANNGWQWVDIFSRFNSGTYNNQWMILNLHLFTLGKGFNKGGFLIAEQMPGLIEVADFSRLINMQGYWASYNIPFFASIYKRSGFNRMYKLSNHSDRWAHDRCPRAKIFKRDFLKVSTLDDLKKIMRYNNWENDSLSKGHPSLAIAARYDLEKSDLFSLNGAIDAKVSTLTMGLHMECEAINGPTSDIQPPFTWRNRSIPILPHLGHPEFFDFSFVKVKHNP